jgi:CheY-like chemotaxis protein
MVEDRTAGGNAAATKSCEVAGNDPSAAATPPSSEPATAGTRPSSPSNAAARKYRILVVDDEPAVLQVLKDMLTAMGHEPVAFASPSEALHKARRQRFDALVLDLYMPEMSGMLFHAKLRVFDPKLAEHTVFISGYVSRDELRAHLASTSAFLEKPFRAEDFTQLVRKVLPAKPRE